ncbi:MAG: Ig-like domain-containing protein [Cystobacter sp.]
MRRMLLLGLLGCAACLEPGESPLAPADTKPPEVVSTEPATGGTVGTTGTLRVLFSERMDARTLRPGIAVFEGRTEVALEVTVPAGSEQQDEVERGDIPFPVTLSAASGALQRNTAYTLVLRTLLTDSQGNALAREVRVPFRTEP